MLNVQLIQTWWGPRAGWLSRRDSRMDASATLHAAALTARRGSGWVHTPAWDAFWILNALWLAPATWMLARGYDDPVRKQTEYVVENG